MPYIEEAQRKVLDEKPSLASKPGELNYVITKQCCDFLDRYGFDYAGINAVVGVLECAKQEFYRRLAVPYEEQKRKDNGDVYYG